MTFRRRQNKINQSLVDHSDIADRFRCEQLQAIIRLTPGMMAIHALIGGFIIWFFYQSTSQIIVWGWGSLLFFVILNNLDCWRRHKKDLIDHDPESINRIIVINAFALSFCWGIAAVLLFPNAEFKQQLALACVMISMMGIGVFSLASLRQAALVYISVFTIFTILSLALTKDDFFLSLTGLQGVWALAVTVALIHHSFLFAERVATQSLLNKRSALVNVLEKDLNEGLNMRRFEMAVDNTIIKMDGQLARDLSYSLAELSNTQFIDLLTHVHSLEKIGDYLNPSSLPDQAALEKKIYELLSKNLKQNVPFFAILIGFENLPDFSKNIGNQNKILDVLGRKLKAALSGKGYVACYEEDKFCILIPAKYDLEKLMQKLSTLLSKGVSFEGKMLVVDASLAAVACPGLARSVKDVVSSCKETLKIVKINKSKIAIKSQGHDNVIDREQLKG